MQKRGNQRGARLWPWLLIVPAAIALIDVGRRNAPPPRAETEAEAGTPERRQPPRRERSSHRAPSPPIPESDPPPTSQPAPVALEPKPAARRVDPCGGVSAYGTCAGQVARACLGGRVLTVDCAERDERCVMTREGASCLPRRGPLFDCLPADAATCAGDVLRLCVDGTWQDIDCALRHARCDASSGRAQCMAAPGEGAVALAARSRADRAIETCDGKDQDSDDTVDEGGVCDEIALVAFVPSGAQLADLEARMQEELAIVNRVFHPLTFAWRRTVPTPLARPLFHPRMFGELAQALSHAEPAMLPAAEPNKPAAVAAALQADGTGAFYIPVLYVESIATTPPKAGMSTLPNARCGGVRVSDAPAPPEGLIVVTEVRQPETLAHEIGHYLGLCHTHEELDAYGAASDAACNGGGDGMCDTAYDPGPPHCAELYTCAAQCDVAATPDTSNIMSYYMMCRSALSAEQLAEAERNLGLRRGWFACLDPGACPCTPGDLAACPAEMSCQPSQRVDRVGECVLDGPALPGARCAHIGDCSGGSICVGSSDDALAPRCVRACSADDATCTCADVGLPYRVCQQDLS